MNKIQAEMIRIADNKILEIGGLPALRTIKGELREALLDARAGMLGMLPNEKRCREIINIIESNN